MVESAALLVDEVLPEAPMRQWLLSVPFPLRYLFARDPIAMGEALGIVHFRHLHNFFWLNWTLVWPRLCRPASCRLRVTSQGRLLSINDDRCAQPVRL
jgi:hypothetical protein